MAADIAIVIERLLAAVFAGGLIGLERNYHGRPAGFRTHTLVCMSSSLLMLLMVFQWKLLPGVPLDTLRIDPTRMAQGIMTGIGFLGAGVIMKERFTIRGLTTAGSIWMTASIGITLGMGFYSAGFIALLLTILTLSIFHRIEAKIPSTQYARLSIIFSSSDFFDDKRLNKLISDHSILAYPPSYHLDQQEKTFEYKMTVRASQNKNFKTLATSLLKTQQIVKFNLVPIGN